ncbi:hypothetical protein Mal52_38070 [Symmachiella dynata]|uniref:Uncharacterized protein n=1 Tax=Symmachiella dynata TaxID=2527995 RepID=A0A517ZS88_9PLAN|nr:hypothetical protein [Symmachiella dynata]QDU45314.1 hypothetical protein Mal52_38070 [Symmachiella dynata]
MIKLWSFALGFELTSIASMLAMLWLSGDIDTRTVAPLAGLYGMFFSYPLFGFMAESQSKDVAEFKFSTLRMICGGVASGLFFAVVFANLDRFPFSFSTWTVVVGIVFYLFSLMVHVVLFFFTISNFGKMKGDEVGAETTDTDD